MAKICNLEMLPQCTPKDVATMETSLTLINLTVLQKERCAKYVRNETILQNSVAPAMRKLSMQ